MSKNHADECCRLHGCLLDGNCPVEVGGVSQKGPCILCPSPGKVGWGDDVAGLLRNLAYLLDIQSASQPNVPTLPEVMRLSKANPKLITQLLYVLSATCHDQGSTGLRLTGEWSSGEVEMEIMIESGEQLHTGIMYLSKEFAQTLLEKFDE